MVISFQNKKMLIKIFGLIFFKQGNNRRFLLIQNQIILN